MRLWVSVLRRSWRTCVLVVFSEICRDAQIAVVLYPFVMSCNTSCSRAEIPYLAEKRARPSLLSLRGNGGLSLSADCVL